MSQGDLARAMRDAGRRTGEQDNCTKRVVQRREAGLVTTPRGTCTRALRYVMGQPVENLGFIPADERDGLDRETAMTMPEAVRVPGPKTAQGPLSGIWLSRYECESSGRRSGKRVGFGRDWDVNVGPWTLMLVTATAAEAIKRYSRTPEPAEAGPGPREPA